MKESNVYQIVNRDGQLVGGNSKPVGPFTTLDAALEGAQELADEVGQAFAVVEFSEHSTDLIRIVEPARFTFWPDCPSCGGAILWVASVPANRLVVGTCSICGWSVVPEGSHSHARDN
jgi:hypothetical protein